MASFVTVVEVCRNACLHDACHVPYWGEAAGASCEKRQNRKAPALPIQPGNDMSSECLSCWHTHSIQQSQSVAEQATEGHVPLLQTCLCGWKGRGHYSRECVTVKNVVEDDNEDKSPGGLNVTTPSRSVFSWASRLVRLMLPPCSSVTKDCTHQHTYTPAFSVSSCRMESSTDYRLFYLFGCLIYKNRHNNKETVISNIFYILKHMFYVDYILYIISMYTQRELEQSYLDSLN